MTPATTHNEATLEAVALIAVCKGSVALMELAVTLRLVAIGATELPAEARNGAMSARIHRRLTSPAWLAAARAALGNEGLGRVAGCFRAACLEHATPKTAEPFDDEDWLREVRSYYALEENMRVLGDAILDLMRLPKVDVEPQKAPPAKPRAMAAPVAAPPAIAPEPQPAPHPRREAPPAEWAIPIALIAIGKAERNPLWVSFGATVGCLSGFWSQEPKLAADSRFSVAATKMLEAPRGFEMATALLHDPVLRTASQAMMMRWHAVTGGGVSSDGLREAMANDAELAVRGEAVLRATCMVMQTLVRPDQTPPTKVASESPRKASVEPSNSIAKPETKSRRVNIRPPALRFVPARPTTRRPVRVTLVRSQHYTPPVRLCHRNPEVEPHAALPPLPRCRLPPSQRRSILISNASFGLLCAKPWRGCLQLLDPR